MNEAQQRLTLEDLDRFLESPVEVVAKQPVLASKILDLTPYLDAAAVLVAFDPFRLRPVSGEFDEGAREGVLDHLLPLSEQLSNGPQQGLWSLSFSERRAALRRMATRERMQQALDANPSRPNTPVQRMFERVLVGVPIALSQLSRDEVAGLITVLDWVEDILDGLPERMAVRSALARADLLAPMQRLAGRGFVGRQRELQQLDDYVFADLEPLAPLFVFGPGGVGKSTLLAGFILDRLEPKNVPFVYIDIDRPTVRPERPLSLLLEAVTQLHQQLNLPLYLFDPFIKEITYGMGRQEKGRHLESAPLEFSWIFNVLEQTLASAGISQQRIVFFVDTFEEAQFLGPDIVWALTEFLFALAHSDAAYRVVISGRALPEEFISRAFPGLLDRWASKERAIELSHLPDCPIDLGVLDEGPARELLQRSIQLAGLPPLGEDDLNALIGIVGRNPMCIKLAARLLRDEGVESFRESRSKFLVKLKAEKIQALLYGRILNHIHGDDVRKVAYPGLIVRRITPAVIREVLAKPCGLELNAQRNENSIYEDLGKEAALVERDYTDGSLRHRGDVRRAMLADLTDYVEPEVVEEIDGAAVAFYETQPGAVARGEEIYHRLRLCEPVDVLNERWSPEAAGRLKGAGEELPAQQRLWLAEKLGITLDDSVRETASQEAWEAQAYRSVDRFLESGAPEKALSVLHERSVRLPRSPLYSLEAEALRFLGQFDEALRVARTGVEAAVNAGAIDVALDLLLKMVVIEETRARLAGADRLLDEADTVAAHTPNETLRLRVKITRLRVQRQLRPEAREERAALRRDVLATLTDEVLHKLRSHPVLLREVAAELGEEDPRITAAAIETLGVEVTSDAQAIALGRAITTLNSAQTSENAPSSFLNRLAREFQGADFDPNVIRKLVTGALTSTDTKNLHVELAKAMPGTKVLGDFREYFRVGVMSAMTSFIKK